MGAVMGHALFSSVLTRFLSSCSGSNSFPFDFFSEEEIKGLNEIVDLILPATGTKSASQVGTVPFLDQVVAHCMQADQQYVIREGLASMMPQLAIAKDKQAFLRDLDKRAYQGDESLAYFKIIKQYTLIGFFTSQEGSTKASQYIKSPGPYKGNVPLTPGMLNYAKTDLYYHL